MTPSFEPWICTRLQWIFEPLSVGSIISLSYSDETRWFFVELQFCFPQLLRGSHPEWRRESLDGFSSLIARKVGPSEGELFGLCILITDYTLTPFRFRFQFDDQCEGFRWLKLQLGERTEKGLLRIPWTGRKDVEPLAQSFVARENEIDWFYHVTYGERRA